MGKIAIAASAAIVVQPLLLIAVNWAYSVYYGASIPPQAFATLGIWALIVASVFVLLLGIPIFLLLKHGGRANWIELGFAGFLAGAAPLGIITWPLRWPGYSSGGNWHGRYVEFFQNGVPTIYGWLQYATDLLQFGLHGLVGALVFLAVWCRLEVQ